MSKPASGLVIKTDPIMERKNLLEALKENFKLENPDDKKSTTELGFFDKLFGKKDISSRIDDCIKKGANVEEMIILLIDAKKEDWICPMLKDSRKYGISTLSKDIIKKIEKIRDAERDTTLPIHSQNLRYNGFDAIVQAALKINAMHAHIEKLKKINKISDIDTEIENTNKTIKKINASNPGKKYDEAKKKLSDVLAEIDRKTQFADTLRDRIRITESESDNKKLMKELEEINQRLAWLNGNIPYRRNEIRLYYDVENDLAIQQDILSFLTERKSKFEVSVAPKKAEVNNTNTKIAKDDHATALKAIHTNITQMKTAVLEKDSHQKKPFIISDQSIKTESIDETEEIGSRNRAEAIVVDNPKKNKPPIP